MNSFEERRKGYDTMGENYPIADGISIEKTDVGGVGCYWFNGSADRTRRFVVYIHGGCYTLGSVRSHKAFVSHVAKRLSLAVLFVEYRLAPENPYPCAENDIVQVLETIVKNYPDAKISFIGDSAGAGLIVSAFPRFIEISKGSLESIALISPWVDLSCSSDAFQSNESLDPILNQDALRTHAHAYIGENSLEAANPLERLTAVFTPTLIVVGTNEVLAGDSAISHKTISKTQLRCNLSIYDGQTHVWPMDNIESESSIRALNELKEFLCQN